jgi:hypothetical protein
MKHSENPNLNEGVFGIVEHLPTNPNFVAVGFKLKTRSYNLQKKKGEWDYDIDTFIGTPIHDIATIIKNTFGIRPQKKVSDTKHSIPDTGYCDNIELKIVKDDRYVVNLSIDEIIRKSEWFLNNLDIKPLDQLKSFSTFCKQKDFSNISPTSTHFINLVLYETTRFYEENDMLDDVDSNIEIYKNLICDNFKLKSADIIKTLVQNEKKKII